MMNDVPPDLSQLCTSPSKVCQKLEAILEPYQRRDSIDQQLPKLRSHIYIDSFGSSHPHSLQVAPVTLSLPPSLPPSLPLPLSLCHQKSQDLQLRLCIAQGSLVVTAVRMKMRILPPAILPSSRTTQRTPFWGVCANAPVRILFKNKPIAYSQRICLSST